MLPAGAQDPYIFMGNPPASLFVDCPCSQGLCGAPASVVPWCRVSFRVGNRTMRVPEVIQTNRRHVSPESTSGQVTRRGEGKGKCEQCLGLG